MATQRIRGWGGHGRWRWHYDDQDPDPRRANGWGGGSQWKAHCAPGPGARIQGFGDGQNKLFCFTGG